MNAQFRENSRQSGSRYRDPGLAIRQEGERGRPGKRRPKGLPEE